MSRHITHFRRTALGATAPLPARPLPRVATTTEMPDCEPWFRTNHDVAEAMSRHECRG